MAEQNTAKFLGDITQFSDLFKLSSDNTARNINVATLGKITAIQTEFPEHPEDIAGIAPDGIAEVEPIPAWTADKQKIEAYFFSNNFEIGDIAAVLFTDLDFHSVIDQPQGINRPTTNKNLHAKTFGILLKL